MKWKSILEELPPIKAKVVVWSDNGAVNAFDHMDSDWLELFDEDNPNGGSGFAENLGPVTHWMYEHEFILPEGVNL